MGKLALFFIFVFWSIPASSAELKLSKGKGEIFVSALGRVRLVLELFNDTGRDLRLTSYSKP